MTNAKQLTFIWKRKTVSGKRGETMVTWSLLPFDVNVMLNLPIVTRVKPWEHEKNHGNTNFSRVSK